MTIFIASFFLPYTVEIRESEGNARPTFLGNVSRTPSQIRTGDYTDIFKASTVLPSIPEISDDAPVHVHPQELEAKQDDFFSVMPESNVSMGGFSPESCRADPNIQPRLEEAWAITPSDLGNKRLDVAVRAVHSEVQDIVRVGTLGTSTDAWTEQRRLQITNILEKDFSCLAVLPSDHTFEGHYSQYCTTMLSPIFHSQIPDHPKSTAYQDCSWVHYREVNQQFADCLVENHKSGDMLCIQDYHLLLVPSLVRQKLPEAKIGFCLHVAFPSSEVFRCLAMRKELLEGILGANLVGFQTQEHCMHFLQACSRLLDVEATPYGVWLDGRFVKVATFPMGVDSNELHKRREIANEGGFITNIQSHFASKHLVVACDKLDNIHGIRQKLLAYEMFLKNYPKYRDKVVLLQTVSQTTQNPELDASINEIVTRINSRYSSFSHQPLIFLKRDLNSAQYLALLSAADVLMVTSLCEGMSLVSHDFILCQDGQSGAKQNGILILSEFTGSASLFKGAELSVNPWDYRQCAEAIRKTLEMSAGEKRQRWQRLFETVERNSGSRWCQDFLAQLHLACKKQAQRDDSIIPQLSITSLATSYQNAKSRLFFLNYEGTLTTHESQGSFHFDQPQRMIDMLHSLLADPANVVYVLSSKRSEDLEMVFQRVAGLGIVAENGCFIRDHVTENWQGIADMRRISAWKSSAAKILEYYQIRIEDSWIEEQLCSLHFHHNGNQHEETVSRHMANSINHIKETFQDLGVEVLSTEDGLLIQPTDWTRTTAAEVIFQRVTKRSTECGTSPADFLLVLGDSREDEALYSWANNLSRAGSVSSVTTASGSSCPTEATTRLTQGVTGVISLLRKLAALSHSDGTVSAS